ncbi:MAG: AAA family ATPase [Acidobacteriota bacterium]
MAAPGTGAVWLAATKVVAPARRRDVLHRERLTTVLANSLEHSRLTLISAPAGAGKTTLLSEIPHTFPDTTWAWLLLDAEDNDPSRFAAALTAALENAGVAVPEGAPSLNDPRALITSVINEVAREQRTVGIVLDDLHVITERSVHELLDYCLDHLPPRLRLVLATRHDPPMALARRRARGELGEIRMQDLGFTEEETGALANQCLSLKLNPDEVRMLHSRTEGWAAGIAATGDIAGRKRPPIALPCCKAACRAVEGSSSFSLKKSSTARRLSCETSCSKPRSYPPCDPPFATR